LEQPDDFQRLTEALMMANTTGNPADDHIYIAIQRFLNREGDCLDRRAFREWLDLWSDDLHYRVTAQVNQDAASGTLEYPIIDEDAVGLKARIDQISNPRLTHAENPPTLVRRFFSNLLVERGEGPNDYVAKSNILVYRTRSQLPDGSLYAGVRQDVLSCGNGNWRLMRRSVCLDQTVLVGSLSVIF
jgi:3-phenylpropionate/cinnamic acid dioxygenase small subunit